MRSPHLRRTGRWGDLRSSPRADARRYLTSDGLGKVQEEVQQYRSPQSAGRGVALGHWRTRLPVPRSDSVPVAPICGVRIRGYSSIRLEHPPVERKGVGSRPTGPVPVRMAT